jgi:hypothetical protein
VQNDNTQSEQKTVETTVEYTAETTTVNAGNKVIDFLKAKKKLIAIVAIVIIVIAIIVDIATTSPKEAVKKFISNLNSGKSEKAFKYIDYAGSYVFSDLDDDEYDDFWENYKEFLDDDDYDDYMDNIKEYMDDDFYEDMDDEIKDSETSIKLKKIESVKKVGKNLYCVKAKIKIKDDDDTKTKTVKFYVMKKGTKSYIVGSNLTSSLTSLTSLF